LNKTHKLYLISYYFAPLGRADGVNRTYLVKYLSEMGWDIDVLSCANPHGFLRSFQKDPSLLDIIPSNVKLNRIKSFYWGPFGEIASLLKLAKDPFWNWGQAVLSNVENIVKEPGIIYAIAPPIRNVLIAAKIAQKKNLPLIIDFRDNVYDLPKKIASQARTIIASTPQSLRDMQQYYNVEGHVIYNGYPTIDISSNSRVFKKDSLKIAFAGVLNFDKDPIVLLKAIALMEKKHPHLKNKIEVHYYGPKNYYTFLYLRRWLKEGVYFHGYLPFNAILSEIAKADFAYCSLGEGFSYAIPSKIFQYIAMETPILAVGTDGSLKELITENNIGRYSQYDDLESQAEDLHELLINPQIRMDMISNLQKIKNKFSMEGQIRTLSPILKDYI